MNLTPPPGFTIKHDGSWWVLTTPTGIVIKNDTESHAIQRAERLAGGSDNRDSKSRRLGRSTWK